MKQLIMWITLLGLVGSLFFPGCAGAPASPTSTQPSDQPLEIVSIGTHPIGSYFNILGTALGKVIGTRTSMKAKVLPLSGPVAWMPMMATHEIDIGVVNSTDAYWGYFGNHETYARVSKGKGFDLRLISVATHNDVSVAVPTGSGIKTLKDLRGKRIAGGYMATPAAERHLHASLANAGLTINDVKLVPVANPPAGVAAVIDGQADAAGTVTTGMPEFTELEAAVGAVILSFDPSPEAQARALEQYPIGWFYLQEGGVYPGVATDSWFLRYENYIVCRADMPQDAVYNIIKAMWDYYEDTAPIHIKFVEWTPDTFVSKMQVVPYHPGAIEFYKEKELWTPEMEKAQQDLLAKTEPSFLK